MIKMKTVFIKCSADISLDEVHLTGVEVVDTLKTTENRGEFHPWCCPIKN